LLLHRSPPPANGGLCSCPSGLDCFSCPFRRECLVFALSSDRQPVPINDNGDVIYPPTVGIYGGTTHLERATGLPDFPLAFPPMMASRSKPRG
jgi:hypothetical protein